MKTKKYISDFALNKFDVLLYNQIPLAEFKDISPAIFNQSYLELAEDLSFRNYVISHNTYMTKHVQPICIEISKAIKVIAGLIDSEIKRFE